MRIIIHHWDTDGICSAALLSDKDTVNMTPCIGNYFLTDDELRRIKQGDFESDCLTNFRVSTNC